MDPESLSEGKCSKSILQKIFNGIMLSKALTCMIFSCINKTDYFSIFRYIVVRTILNLTQITLRHNTQLLSNWQRAY